MRCSIKKTARCQSVTFAQGRRLAMLIGPDIITGDDRILCRGCQWTGQAKDCIEKRVKTSSVKGTSSFFICPQCLKAALYGKAETGQYVLWFGASRID
jgi:hypothetical protein